MLLSVVMVTMCLVLGAPLRGGAAESRLGGQSAADWGPHRRIYDPKTVATLKGQVMSIDHVHGRNKNVLVQFGLKTETETITVFLGPERYLERQPVKVAVGDQVTVKGSRIRFRQRPFFLAAEVRKGETVLKLRDANGAVLWTGSPDRPSEEPAR